MQRPTPDRALTLLLVVLAGMIFIAAPLVQLGILNREITNASFVLMLAVGALAVADDTLPARLTYLCAGVVFAIALLRWWNPANALFMAEYLASIAGTGLLGVLLLRRVMYGPVSTERLKGAVAVYLVIGLMFANAYRLIALAHPGAFVIGGMPASFETASVKLTYFSFTTLTTLGYGDMSPMHPYAQTLTMLESLVGIVFPVALATHLILREIRWYTSGILTPPPGRDPKKT
jgi:hypothetical protein